MRKIKRYSNRKLYDTDESRYVTLPLLTKLIKEGENIEVTDNVTGRDITSATLAQLLYEQERRAPELPVTGLHALIRNGLEA